MQGIQKWNKTAACEAQSQTDDSLKRNRGPSVPQALSDRPKEVLLTLEQDKSEVIGSSTSHV